MYDIIIIGGGPAGLTAAIYSARSGHKTLLLEGGAFGGQMALTEKIENYPAFPNGVEGVELGRMMREQAENLGAEIKRERAKTISLVEKTVVTRKSSYSAEKLILAMGASPRPLGVKGEKELMGAGVSYCAVCDGGFFKGRTVAIIGGGDTAVHDCEYLSRICEKVYLIHRRDMLRGGEAAFKRINLPNVEFVPNAEAEEFIAENGKLKEILLKDGRVLAADGVFVAVGTLPRSELVADQLHTEDGYIVTDENMKTSVPGVYAVGDIRKKNLRQVVTAAADGAVAASDNI
ncbi:MAG: FAD-dependent oxidoreductase [Oscillospiraceae bacterium]|nr:FAD-dependent oxidoreductase [Oscillospiraceae bacterium]